MTQADVYSDSFQIPTDIDVAYIDAGHTARQIMIDIERLIKINPNIILIFDDYGQPDRVIANTLQEFINKSNFQISQYIGEYNGFTCKNGKITFATREGVILTAQK